MPSDFLFAEDNFLKIRDLLYRETDSGPVFRRKKLMAMLREQINAMRATADCWSYNNNLFLWETSYMQLKCEYGPYRHKIQLVNHRGAVIDKVVDCGGFVNNACTWKTWMPMEAFDPVCRRRRLHRSLNAPGASTPVSLYYVRQRGTLPKYRRTWSFDNPTLFERVLTGSPPRSPTVLYTSKFLLCGFHIRAIFHFVPLRHLSSLVFIPAPAPWLWKKPEPWSRIVTTLGMINNQ